MELTRGEIEHYLYQVEHNIIKLGNSTCSCILRQLLAEMDKPKDNVWKSADKCVNRAIVNYVSSDGRDYGAIEFMRELPKSRIDEIAEAAMKLYIPNDDSKLTAIIKGAILAYAEESK